MWLSKLSRCARLELDRSQPMLGPVQVSCLNLVGIPMAHPRDIARSHCVHDAPVPGPCRMRARGVPWGCASGGRLGRDDIFARCGDRGGLKGHARQQTGSRGALRVPHVGRAAGGSIIFPERALAHIRGMQADICSNGPNPRQVRPRFGRIRAPWGAFGRQLGTNLARVRPIRFDLVASSSPFWATRGGGTKLASDKT